MKNFAIGFFEHRKIFFAISLGIMAVGLIFNFIFGTQLDINFKGGAFIRYSYSGEIDTAKVEDAVESAANRDVTVTINENVKSADGSATLNNVTLSFAGNDALTLENQQAVDKALNTAYPDAKFDLVNSDSVNPTMGQSFFAKCIVAVLIAFLLLDLYIALRFRKIGGTAAGVFAIVALLHDVVMVYFTFVIFRIPLNDNFIAVVLTILGYSLNDTIVIYDRIRENRKLLGSKTDYSVLVNTSINQTFTRSVYTAGCTFTAIAVVFIVGTIYDLSSVTTFALPMMVGVVTGCYSSICIAGPLYVMWEKRKQRIREEAFTASRSSRLESPRAEKTENQAPTAPSGSASPKAPSAGNHPSGKPRPKKRKR
jgi:preprotein translocase subunit SecF